MIYTEKDFTGCIINPLQKDLLKRNRALSELVPVITEEEEIKIFSPEEIEGIFRYIIMISDPQSILVKKERDLNRRKELAAEAAELDSSDEYLKTIYNCTHPLMVPLSVGYLKTYVKTKEHAVIFAIENTFWENIRRLMDPQEASEKKAKLKIEVSEDIKLLDEYYDKFCGQDIELAVKVKSSGTSPESFGKKGK